MLRTLLNEFNSDAERFTTHDLNLSCNKSGCCRFWKVVAERRVALLFAPKFVHDARFNGPWQTCFATPVYGVTPALFHTIRSQLFTQLAATRFVATCTTGLNVDDKTRNITFARFAPMLRNNWHAFVARLTLAYATYVKKWATVWPKIPKLIRMHRVLYMAKTVRISPYIPQPNVESCVSQDESKTLIR